MRDRLSTKSMSVSSGGLAGRRCITRFSLFIFCIVLNFSAIRARDAAVEALDTGIRGLELLSGGEIFGGGAIMLALSEGLFAPCGTPRPGEVIRPGLGRSIDRFCFVLELLGGGFLISGFGCGRSWADAALEFGIELPESEAALILRALTGTRDVTGGLLSDIGEAR